MRVLIIIFRLDYLRKDSSTPSTEFRTLSKKSARSRQFGSMWLGWFELESASRWNRAK